MELLENDTNVTILPAVTFIFIGNICTHQQIIHILLHLQNILIYALKIKYLYIETDRTSS